MELLQQLLQIPMDLLGAATGMFGDLLGTFTNSLG
jgi:hypothetical protein